MHKILHRINTKELLKNTPIEFGIEVDIRSNNNKLIMHHDPFKDGELFEQWLNYYNHGTIILNVKEEGLEDPILKLMKKYSINNFFFLDQSFPFLRKTAGVQFVFLSMSILKLHYLYLVWWNGFGLIVLMISH